MIIRKRKIESEVRRILADNRVTEPPVPVELIARSIGLYIRHQALDSDISGFLYQDSDNAVIGVNSHHPPARQRFTIAHELGHYVLHQGDPFHIDRTFRVQFRQERTGPENGADEAEANLFAATLLMPNELLREDLDQMEVFDFLDEAEVSDLAHKYGVSAQALLIRLASLGYVSP